MKRCHACPTTPIDHTFGPAFSVEGAYAHRLANFKVASLHLEVPILFAPSRTTDSILGSSDFSTFFLTPALKVKFLPSSGISPFISAGGGFDRFKEGSTTANGGAFQVGGGLDFKTRLPLLGFRLEVRDFITGRPGILSFSAVSSDHVHNVFAGGGITLRF